MAIAPLMEYEGLADGTCGLLERPWPRAVLRVVPETSLLPVDAVPADVAGIAVATGRAGQLEDADVSPGAPSIGRRRAAVRRRRVLVAALVAGLVAVLALPLSALGGAASTPRGGAATAATVYVVQPGDTLWSIASRFDRGGDTRPLAEAIARETGSATVVPGERIAIP